MALSISFIHYIAAQVIPIGTMKHMLSRDHMSGRHDELDYLLTNIIEFELRSLTIAHTKTGTFPSSGSFQATFKQT